MPYRPVGMNRPMSGTAQSGLPPNRMPQAPGMSPTGPLNLAGPPKMPSATNGVNTSKPMAAGPMGMPKTPGAFTPESVRPGMPGAGGMGGGPPPMIAPPIAGGGRFGSDALVGPQGLAPRQAPQMPAPTGGGPMPVDGGFGGGTKLPVMTGGPQPTMPPIAPAGFGGGGFGPGMATGGGTGIIRPPVRRY